MLWVGLLNSTAFANAPSFRQIDSNIFAYIGQREAHGTRLIVLGGYRMYSPDMGLFLKQDGYSPFLSYATLNGFNYVAGNPVLLVDVTGHMPKDIRGVP